MAKNRVLSKNSRAARRQTSPSINTDKSLKEANPPPSSRTSLRPNVLSLQRSAGVTKKLNKRKTVLSAKARKRHERGLQMAEAIEDRTRNKVERSVGRVRVVKDRSKAWEDINKVAEGTVAEGNQEKGRGMFDLLGASSGNGEDEEKEGGKGGGDDDDGWETDENMGAEGEEAGEKEEEVVQTTTEPKVDDDLDEIL